ncbi:hypothetical protein J41TS12_37100 [Paenibacillus antibioticophila]|uniref:Uncharacterized protein n=1 Tax=Paenibacillus antibioticophila TaxID=1274374 RepID=A0A919XVP8_9BACL|nr:hypothetical protein [Paenibacillus antibioticophila]GIO38849.1 hypothetical protein J41TS12_37100 [Paenibacillus antibioticophila]
MIEYDIQEDLAFAHVVNRHGKSMTAHQMIPLVAAQYPAMSRSTGAASQHVNFIRRLLNGKCSKYPAKYTNSVINQLKKA